MAEGSPSGVRVEVHGLAKLTRALKKAGVDVADMKAANARVGSVVVQAATPITPRASGDLAGSIKPANRTSGVVVRAGGGRIKYAKYVEYGTKRMRPRSYLVKAAHDSQPRWLDVYSDELVKITSTVESSANGTGD
jgi:HK97 gp10 family phage protein